MRLSTVLALLAAPLVVGCLGGEPPLPPDEALAKAAASINAILQEQQVRANEPVVAPPTETPQDAAKVSFWFPAHPLIAPALGPRDQVAAFNAAHPGATLDAQFIGEWPYAVQKLTVTVAAGDLPDLALVTRSWLARLADARLIAPLDTLLPPALVADLRPQVQRAFTVAGHLYAFPADGFCSLLYYNRDLVVGPPPRTWNELRDVARSLTPPASDATRDFYVIGYIPFLESLWSAGGDACEGTKCGLDGPAAHEALDFVLSLGNDGLAHPRAQGYPDGAFQLFLAGKIAMTVASSALLPQTKGVTFNVGIAPVPGRSGPISLFSDNAIVVFRKYADAKRTPIAQLLDFLTGPDVLGRQAILRGSAPVRTSVATPLDANPPSPLATGLEQAFQSVRATPLLPMWSNIESEMDRYLSLAYQWQPPAR